MNHFFDHCPIRQARDTNLVYMQKSAPEIFRCAFLLRKIFLELNARAELQDTRSAATQARIALRHIRRL